MICCLCLLAADCGTAPQSPDLESGVFTFAPIRNMSKTLLTKGKVKLIYKMEPKIRNFAVRAFLTFYIYYIIKFIKSQNIYG